MGRPTVGPQQNASFEDLRSAGEDEFVLYWTGSWRDERGRTNAPTRRGVGWGHSWLPDAFSMSSRVRSLEADQSPTRPRGWIEGRLLPSSTCDRGGCRVTRSLHALPVRAQACLWRALCTACGKSGVSLCTAWGRRVNSGARSRANRCGNQKVGEITPESGSVNAHFMGRSDASGRNAARLALRRSAPRLSSGPGRRSIWRARLRRSSRP